jgi:hypothetical protein
MTLIPRADLERLAQRTDGPSISIYLPTHRTGREVEQDRIRLKNLIDEAEEQLLEAGASAGDVDELLGILKDQVLPQPLFWQHQLEGLSIFRSADLLYVYRLPYSFESVVVVGSDFHIKPLLPLLSKDGQFYLLTLHEDEIHFYQGTRYNLSHVEVEEIPADLEELFAEQDEERPQQWHTDTRTPGGAPAARTRPAAFHGHGAIEQHDEVETRKYFRKVDEALNKLMAQEQEVPLVIAGIDDLIPLYEEANTYPYLVEDEGISMDPHVLDLQALHRKAWDVVEPRFTEERTELVNTYQMLAGQGNERASDELDAIVPAAVFERVEVLWVPLGVQVWGTFDPETAEIEVHDEPGVEDQDLLDLAAEHTLFNSGTIYAVEPGEVPGDGNLAAIFRY